MVNVDKTAARHLIDSDQLFPLIRELLVANKTVRLKVRGDSMYPFIRSDLDDITLEYADFNAVKKRDIVLIKRRSGAYVLHRVCKITEREFYMLGDAQQDLEGPLYPEQLVAKGVSIVRNGRELRCDAWGMRLAAWIWLLVRPVRPFLFKAYRKVRRALR